MSTPTVKTTGSVTSFRKKGPNSINIKGTRISTQNAQLLTSTGSSTLDFFIGGGLAIGTVCLVEEDRHNTYSKVLLKYFLSEGFTHEHKLFLSSGEKSSEKLISELPSMKASELKIEEEDKNNSSNVNLVIAWRYQNKASSFASDIKADSYNQGYDLSKPIPKDVLHECSITLCDPPIPIRNANEPAQEFLPLPYSHVMESISSEINYSGYRTSNKSCDNVMRIAINSLGSPLWNSNSANELHIVRFLYLLKALLRTSFAVAFVSVPSYLLENVVLRNRIRQMCDTVISLESFVGSDKKSNPLFKDFDGLLHIVKLPVLNTYMYPTLVSDLAFKLKRKDIVIERLHLPPDFEESSDVGSMGCSGTPSKLDF